MSSSTELRDAALQQSPSIEGRGQPPQGRSILIVSAGSTFERIRDGKGDFDQWIEQGIDGHAAVCRLDARQSGVQFPNPGSLAGIVITGSPAMVTDKAPWSEALAAWLRECVAANIPVLGICFGHQLLAHAMGGEVAYNAVGLSIGTQDISLCEDAAEDPLFQDFPQAFPAHFVHSQSVIRLPSGATRLVAAGKNPNMAFRIGQRAWGVQFHPEFTAPIMKAYLEEISSRSPESAAKFQVLLDQVKETPAANALLEKFARLAVANDSSNVLLTRH